MPENIYSQRALLKNGFIKEDNTVQEKNWGGKESVDLYVYTFKAGFKNQKQDKYLLILSGKAP